MLKDLLIVICFMVIVTLVFYILKTNREIRQMIDILEDIRNQESKQKFLVKEDDRLFKVKHLLNDIFYEYERRIEDFTTMGEANQHLMTSLSHDIRTPMTTLIGYIDAICMKLVNEEQRKRYIELAKDKAYDIKEYMDILFEWFRLNSDEEVFQIEKLDIAEKSRQILTDWIPLLEEEKIDFEISIPEDEVTVNIDDGSYSRIINNIMQNILFHSHADKINIDAEISAGRFIIKIRDNGVGIPKQNLKYIFERLYKCDDSRHDKGSGLGLNIVKILTEKMNGTVAATSEVDRGTEFTLSFPIE